MEMTLDTWHLVKGTPKVTGFVGNAKTPNEVPAVSDIEVNRLTTQISEGSLKPKPKVQFEEEIRSASSTARSRTSTARRRRVKPDKASCACSSRSSGARRRSSLDFMQVEKT